MIAVPAHYDIHQRWATVQAAEIAGFSSVRLINEATAAVLAYKKGSPIKDSVLVFDFGAGTLDVSVVEWEECLAEVKACAGDNQLGGDDFDEVIFNLAREQIRKHIGNVQLDAFQGQILTEVARQAKIQLSSASETTLHLPGFIRISNITKDLSLQLDRQTFETAAKPLFDRAKQVLTLALEDSRISHTQVSKLLLVGGTSRLPYIRRMVEQIVEQAPITSLDPESGVCEGACLLSAVYSGTLNNLLLLDVTPISYSVGLKDDVASVVIPRNTTLPTRKINSFTTAEDNQTEITVRVYQGESALASKNSFVGQPRLAGITPAPSGTPGIDICFDIDNGGNLRVSATDKATQKKVEAVLESPYRLNPAQMKLLHRKVHKEIEAHVATENNRRTVAEESEVRALSSLSSCAISMPRK